MGVSEEKKEEKRHNGENRVIRCKEGYNVLKEESAEMRV